MYAYGKRDPVPIDEHPHLHDRKRAVLLAFAVFPEAVHVRLFYFEEEVRAVVIDHPGVSGAKSKAVTVHGFLYEVRFFSQYIKSSVYLMLLEERLFDQRICISAGGYL